MRKQLHFEPNPAQEQLLRAMRRGKRHLLRAGWGTGKTTLGAFCAQRLAHMNPGVNGLVASHNYNHVSVNLVPQIIEHLKDAGTYVGKHENKRLIYLTTGAVIQWGSADKAKSLDGNDVGWGIGDEIRHWPKDSYETFQSRIRDARATYPAEILLTTPDMNWIFHEFAEDPELIEVVAPTHANKQNLRLGYIEDQLKRLSVALAKQFIYAEWIGAEGNAFPEFDRSIHVQDNLAEADSDGWVHVHPNLDFGGKHAATYMQTFDFCSRHGTQNCFHIVGEWMPDSIPTFQFAAQLQDDIRQRGMKPKVCFPDKAGYGINYQTGVRDIELLENAGFKCQWVTDPASVSIVNGVDLIRSMLAPVRGKPRLYFDSSLLNSERGIVTALESAKTDGKDRRYKKDGVFEHALDATRYGIVNIEPPVDLKAVAY